MPFETREIKERLLADNEKAAAGVRKTLSDSGIFFVNIMASPGAGKTTLLEKTIKALKGSYRIGVMEADADGDVDAARLSEYGIKVLQVHTGGLCHMDADMTERALSHLPLEELDLVFLENVGNLVCPAEFDVGASLSVCLLSIPEGDDKPLKYPLMFTVADAVLISKTDVWPAFDFDAELFQERVHALNPACVIMPLSAEKEEGLEEWLSFLKERIKAK